MRINKLMVLIFRGNLLLFIDRFLNYQIIRWFALTLILSTPKVISLCQQYRVRPVCTSVQSDQALYCWADQLQVLILISR